MLTRVSWLGVVVGAIVDMIGSSLASGIFLAIRVPAQGGDTMQDIAAQVRNAADHDPLVFIVSLIIGACFSVLGGYIAAAIANRSFVLNGALSAWLCIAFGAFHLLSGGHLSHGLIYAIVAMPMSAAFGALGGYLKSLGRSVAVG